MIFLTPHFEGRIILTLRILNHYGDGDEGVDDAVRSRCPARWCHNYRAVGRQNSTAHKVARASRVGGLKRTDVSASREVRSVLGDEVAVRRDVCCRKCITIRTTRPTRSSASARRSTRRIWKIEGRRPVARSVESSDHIKESGIGRAGDCCSIAKQVVCRRRG